MKSTIERRGTGLTHCNVNFSAEQIKKLNYEVMYKMLEGKVEKFVLENQGNPLVDNFKNDIVQTFSHLLTQLQK